MAGPLDLKGTVTIKDNAKAPLRDVAGALKDIGKASSAVKPPSLAGSIDEIRRLQREYEKLRSTQERQYKTSEVLARRREEAARRELEVVRQQQRSPNFTKGVAVGAVARQEVGGAARRVFQDAGSVEQERKLLSAQGGLTPSDLAAIESRAEEISARYRQISKAAAMRAIGELRMPLMDRTGAAHAMEFMDTAAKAHSILTNMTHLGKLQGVNSDEAIYDLAKAMEFRNIRTKEGMTHGTEMMLKSIVASGGKIDALDWHMVSKSARGALNGLSDKFLYTMLPAFMQEFKASGGTATQAGTGLLSLYRTVVGGRMTPRSMLIFDELGLLNNDKVVRKKALKGQKQGDPKYLLPGAVKGDELAQKDPFQWVQQYLKPAMEAHGITDPEEQMRTITAAFSNQVSEHMAQMLLVQDERLKNIAAMIEQTAGIEDLYKNFENAPTQAMAELSAQMQNMIAAFGDPLIPAAIASMKGLAEVAKSLAELANQHPVAGLGTALVGGGALGYGFLRFARRFPRFAGGLAGLSFTGDALISILGAGLAGGLTANKAPGLARWFSMKGTPLRMGAGAAVGGGLLARYGGRVARFVPGLGWVIMGGGAAYGGYQAWKHGGSGPDIVGGTLAGGAGLDYQGPLPQSKWSPRGQGVPATAPTLEAKTGPLPQVEQVRAPRGQDVPGMAAAVEARTGSLPQVEEVLTAGRDAASQLRAIFDNIDLSVAGQHMMESLASGITSGGAAAIAAAQNVAAGVRAAGARVPLNTGPTMQGD